MHFYRPRLHETSHAFPANVWETMWGWLPSGMRILDPRLFFRSTSDGMSCLAMQKALAKSANRPMIFVVNTTEDEVFGAFCPFAFRPDSKALAEKMASESFVFQLKPNSVAYWWSGLVSSTWLMDFAIDHIWVGGEDVAICTDGRLLEGQSRSSKAFQSPPLSTSAPDGSFKIKLVEVWLLK